MRSLRTNAVAALFALTPLSLPTEQLSVQPQSRLWIEGTSTIRGFECKAPEFALKVSAEDGGGTVTRVLGGQKAVNVVELTVPAAKLECGNGTMNDHMRKAIKADDNATIRFTLTGYDVASNAKGAEGTLRGTLSLGGAERPIEVTAAALDAGAGMLRVVGSYELSLSAFDLKAPSLMFGRIKVGDKVQVKFDVVLKS